MPPSTSGLALLRFFIGQMKIETSSLASAICSGVDRCFGSIRLVPPPAQKHFSCNLASLELREAGLTWSGYPTEARRLSEDRGSFVVRQSQGHETKQFGLYLRPRYALTW